MEIIKDGDGSAQFSAEANGDVRITDINDNQSHKQFEKTRVESLNFTLHKKKEKIKKKKKNMKQKNTTIVASVFPNYGSWQKIFGCKKIRKKR